MGEPLSLPAAAVRLGFTGHPGDAARRLHRLLKAYEERTGSIVMLPAGGSGRGRRYYVTIDSLRTALPEFFPARDEILEAARAELAALEDRLEDTADRGDLIADQLVELSRKLARVERRGGTK